MAVFHNVSYIVCKKIRLHEQEAFARETVTRQEQVVRRILLIFHYQGHGLEWNIANDLQVCTVIIDQRAAWLLGSCNVIGFRR